MLVCVCATLGCTVFYAVSMVSCGNIDAELQQSSVVFVVTDL